jgi:hypothetical protein
MLLQHAINGLVLGSVYALIAVGFSLVFSVLEIINFSHGAMLMLGAYFGLVLIGTLGKAAGTAAVLSLESSVSPRRVNVRRSFELGGYDERKVFIGQIFIDQNHAANRCTSRRGISAHARPRIPTEGFGRHGASSVVVRRLRR